MSIRKIMGQAHYMQQADDGSTGNASGPSATTATVDVNNPEIQKLIRETIERETAGLKNKNSELLGKLKETQALSKQWEGFDVEKVQTLMKRMEQDEELKLLADGKVDEVVNRRIELRERDWTGRYGALETKLNEYENTIKQKEERLRQLTIDSRVTQAFQTLGYEPTAMEEMVTKARSVFIMDDEGNVIPRDNHGNIIYGKDAKTPISVTQWLESLADSKPWLRGPNKGTGATQNRGMNKSVDTSKMSSAQRIAEGLRARGIV